MSKIVQSGHRGIKIHINSTKNGSNQFIVSFSDIPGNSLTWPLVEILQLTLVNFLRNKILNFEKIKIVSLRNR